MAKKVLKKLLELAICILIAGVIGAIVVSNSASGFTWRGLLVYELITAGVYCLLNILLLIFRGVAGKRQKD